MSLQSACLEYIKQWHTSSFRPLMLQPSLIHVFICRHQCYMAILLRCVITCTILENAGTILKLSSSCRTSRAHQDGLLEKHPMSRLLLRRFLSADQCDMNVFHHRTLMACNARPCLASVLWQLPHDVGHIQTHDISLYRWLLLQKVTNGTQARDAPPCYVDAWVQLHLISQGIAHVLCLTLSGCNRTRHMRVAMHSQPSVSI